MRGGLWGACNWTPQYWERGQQCPAAMGRAHAPFGGPNERRSCSRAVPLKCDLLRPLFALQAAQSEPPLCNHHFGKPKGTVRALLAHFPSPTTSGRLFAALPCFGTTENSSRRLLQACTAHPGTPATAAAAARRHPTCSACGRRRSSQPWAPAPAPLLCWGAPASLSAVWP